MGYVSTWMGQCTACVFDGFATRTSRPKPLLTLFSNVNTWASWDSPLAQLVIRWAPSRSNDNSQS